MAKAKNVNIMLMFLSTMGGTEIDLAKKRQKYLLETGKEEDCVQTNEAAVYNVANILKAKRESLAAIYFFATEDMRKKTVRIVDGGKELYPRITQLDFLEKRWKARYKELAATQFRCIDYNYSAGGDSDIVEESKRRVSEMAEAVKSFSGSDSSRGQWKNYALYVDITGGFRHAAMMMTSLVQLLQYSGMKLKKLLYSDFQPGRELNKVFDFTEIGRQYRLISGAEEFSRFGSVYSIEKYFGVRYEELKEKADPSY